MRGRAHRFTALGFVQIRERRAVERQLGQLLYFSAANATGSYHLDLANESEREASRAVVRPTTTPATSAPALGSPLPHLHRDRAMLHASRQRLSPRMATRHTVRAAAPWRQLCSCPSYSRPPRPCAEARQPQLLLKLLRLRHADHKAELAASADARAHRESERGNRTGQHADGEQPECEVRP